ncbi:MAG: nucleotidyltransferase domain-containing protein [Chloroflexi bacterium]|nr:nucleotidyltransferase domain-containing protein [Chloroflexota bacterium]MBL7200708.1 nucleotidyltransferase domain-containing protein [Anaerolineae bacterium]
MELDLDDYMSELADLCATFGVRRLDLFGSACRSDFDLAHSDIDFLVDFAEAHPLDAFDRYLGLKEGLEQLFERSVDLVEEKAIKNPYFRQAIERDRVFVYG